MVRKADLQQSLSRIGLLPIGDCLPGTLLGLRVLTDFRRWAAARPGELGGHSAAEGMAFTAAMVSPWRTPAQLASSMRMWMWTYALDDFSEAGNTAFTDLDEMFGRCHAIVRTGRSDDGHPLLTVLSELQNDLMRQPRYEAFAPLWEGRFLRCLNGMRYDWIAGHSRLNLDSSPPDVSEYLDHIDSILTWMAYPVRWIHDSGADMADELDVLEHLELFIRALDSNTFATRLANDLATAAWERNMPGQNNILNYGVSPDWVRQEIDRHNEAVIRILAPLADQGHLPAIELTRLTEWNVHFYRMADFRDSNS